MSLRSGWAILALAALAPGGAFAQPNFPTAVSQTHFNSGQDVVPAFEGWLRNPDGSFTMVFGYFNRNFKEELAIPAGPNNKLEPGEPDRGQPTYFLPRRQSFIFRVQVPKNWGQKELIWTITANGHTEKAYGSLLPVEEITERMIMVRGGLNPGDDDPNKPPVLTIAPVQGATTGGPVNVTAMVTDDGLPKPKVPRPRPVTASTGQTNTAQTNNAQTNSVGAARPRGLTVSWIQYGGPAKVTLDRPGAVTGGQSVIAAHFPEPGTYVLQATANDGELSVRSSITITVK